MTTIQSFRKPPSKWLVIVPALILLWIVVIMCGLRSSIIQPEQSQHQLWEYQISPGWELTTMGQLGWELVAVVPDGRGGGRLLYKRARGPLTQQEQTDLQQANR